jgi:translation initiation factor 1
MKTDPKLVYSTDPVLNKKCERCKQVAVSCVCNTLSETVDYKSIRAVLRLEKAHRAGKDVSVIDRLPPIESFLKDLAQDLKKRCGAGGTFKIMEKVGIIEIQGDKRDLLRKELERLGIKCI